MDGWVASLNGYYVGDSQANRHNYSQFETYNNNGVWMGGGLQPNNTPSQYMTMYWNVNQNFPNGPWYQWGVINSPCVDAPYVNSVQGTYYWGAGGY